MSSTTPNLGLTLPIGTEKVSRQIINGNNTLIDTAVGTLNSKIDNLGYDIGSKTVSGFQTDIETKLGALGNGQSFSFKVDLSDNASPISSGTHTGFATRSVSGRYNVLLQRSGSSTCISYAGSLTSNGWCWEVLATDSNLPKYTITSTTSGTLNANTDNTITIDAPGSYNEILAIVPIGYTPATSWNTRLQFTNVTSLVNHTIGARTIGSDSQKYTIRCLVVYK